MGSGVRNIYKYNRIYSGADPIFIEEDVFKTIIPLVLDKSDQVNDQANEEIRRILEFCEIPRKKVNKDIRDNYVESIIKGYIDSGFKEEEFSVGKTK